MTNRDDEAEAEEFVRLWQRARTVSDVATALGLTVRQVCNRAAWLRKGGVPLKLHVRSANKTALDYDRLAKIARGEVP